MKRFFKIFGISLGVIILLCVIVAITALYVVFTPSRVTPIVDGLAGKYLTCDHKIESVEFTLFSTFPQLGLRANGVSLINTTAGAPSDTVAHVNGITGLLDVKKLINERHLQIHSLIIEGGQAMIYTDSAGIRNFLVFRSDTTTADTSSSWPLTSIALERVAFDGTRLRYIDERNGLNADITNVNLDLAGTMSGDSVVQGSLNLSTQSASMAMGEKQYLAQQPLSISIPAFRANIDSLAIDMTNAAIEASHIAFDINGSAAMPHDTISINAEVASANAIAIDSLLAFVERNMPGLLPKLDIHGDIDAKAHIQGEYYEGHMPLITAHTTLNNGKGSYKDIPYELNDVDADLDIVLNLNDSTQSLVLINSLSASTLKSSARINGSIDELLGNMLIDINGTVNIHLPDVAHYLPKNMALSGTAQGPLALRTRLSDITAPRLDRIKATAQMALEDFDVKYDDITAAAKAADIALRLPSGNARAPFAHVEVSSQDLKAKQGGKTDIAAQGIDIKADVNDLTAKTLKNIIADAEYSFQDLKARYDNINLTLAKPAGKAFVNYNTATEKAIPAVNASLRCQDLAMTMDTISANLKAPDITINLAGQQQRKDLIKADVKYAGNAVALTMGSQIHTEMAQLHFEGAVRQDDQQFDFLNIWNPNLKIKLTEGMAQFALLPYIVEVPAIDFDFTPDKLDIAQSKVRLGNSDFSLQGSVLELNKWLGGEANLGGELNFTSDYTDVNQLMDLTSGFGDKDSTATESDMSDGDPFMVPKGVDLILHTRIHRAAIGSQIANELGGNLYINDGTLVLEEMGFICQAAHLQLTALYKTPRRNHIYTGLDLHMLDIHIAELLDMIPEAKKMLPMLSSFSGKAEFHLALETYMNAKYELKTSTSIGAASLQGKDLVLLDSETFSQIAKLLMFRKKTENIVDSISAEITLWNRQVDIYPFMMSIDKYAAAVGGQHNLDGTYDYHISLVRPLAIGVNVKTGDDKKLHIKPTLPRYKSNFEPVRRESVEAQNLKLREKIREELKRNVK